MKRKVCSLEAFISSHSTYVIQCHPVLKGTTQDIWHVSIRRRLHHNHSLTASCSHTLREPHSPLRLLQRVPHRLDLLEMTGHICAHDHLDHQRTQLPVENTAQHNSKHCTHTLHSSQEQTPRVPPVILREVDQDVHLIFLHESVGCAHVVVFQNRAIVVQDGHFWSVQDQRKKSPKRSYILSITLTTLN